MRTRLDLGLSLFHRRLFEGLQLEAPVLRNEGFGRLFRQGLVLFGEDLDARGVAKGHDDDDVFDTGEDLTDLRASVASANAVNDQFVNNGRFGLGDFLEGANR